MNLSSPQPAPFVKGKLVSKYALLVSKGEMLTRRSVYSRIMDSGGRMAGGAEEDATA